MENQKKEIRKRYKKMREDMTAEQVAARSREICENILSSTAFREADWILAYYPLGNEADVRPVVREAWRQGKRVAFPKVFGEEMRFFEVHDFSELHPGTFGVMEPEGDVVRDKNAAQDAKETAMGSGKCSLPVQRKQKLTAIEALMLVPGVAFDRAGNRMGFGKGYYDRYLAAWREGSKNGMCIPRNRDFVSADALQGEADFRIKKCACSLVTMGVAYGLQVAERIPTEETDVPLDYLVTENGQKNFARANTGE